MPDPAFAEHFRTQLDGLKTQGLYKRERSIQSPQRADITVNGREVVNFCANNYLGLANHPAIVAAARDGLDHQWGYGMASVRFICGTQDLHKQARKGRHLGTSSARTTRSFTARAGTPTAGCSRRSSASRTPILSDELNHASIIDGVRLCKAKRLRYKHNDMADLGEGAEGGEGLPLPDDLHRQRVQHGRRPGEAAGHLRTRRSLTTRRRRH